MTTVSRCSWSPLSLASQLEVEAIGSHYDNDTNTCLSWVEEYLSLISLLGRAKKKNCHEI